MTDGAGGCSRRPSPVAPDGPARSAATVPLYQPGDTKVMRITLTEAQWWVLSERLVEAKKSDEGPRTLEQFINEIIREAAEA